jgi:hypothetical protein
VSSFTRNFDLSGWESSFEDHPQHAILKKAIDRAVHDIFLQALREQHNEFLSIFESEDKIEDFVSRTLKYWETEEIYEICAEIQKLKKQVIQKWKEMPIPDKTQAKKLRDFLQGL